MKLGYVIVYVPDVAAAVAFYERAFGVERRFVHESGQYAELETGATALAFAHEELPKFFADVARNRVDGKAAGVEVAFVTDEVAAAFARAVAAGAVAVEPPTEKPWGQTVCYVRDRNGFLVEICSPVQH
jgi:lactoylglutathione lyase